MEKYILANVRTFCTNLGQPKASSEKSTSGWSVAQNMSDWCNYLTFDVMGDLCFGKAFEMLENASNHHVIDLIGNAAHTHLIVSTRLLSRSTFANSIDRHISNHQDHWLEQNSFP